MVIDFVKKQGEIAQLDICMEECAELIHACSKMKRAKGYGYKTRDNEAVAYQDLLVQISHCVNSIRGVMVLEQITGNALLQETYFSDIKSLLRLLTEEEKLKWETENRGLANLVTDFKDNDAKEENK